MKRNIFLSLFAISFFWMGCNCPDDELKGELDLGQKSRDFVTYDGTETLVFADETGATISLTAPRGMEVAMDKLCYRTTCTEAKYGSPSSCDYYNTESRRFTYFSADNQIVLDVLLYADNYGYGMPEFYDALQVGYSNGTSSLLAQYLIKVRVEGTIEPEKITLSDLFEEQPEIELNGNTFSDVLVFEEGLAALYFKEGQGVIGFKNTEHTWVIQE